MVVFVSGRAKKSEYRRFRINYDKGANDFAMMAETLRRRLRYLQPDTNAPGEQEDASIAAQRTIERTLTRRERFHERPDLIIIDGGKGQLGAVVEVLEELDLLGHSRGRTRQGERVVIFTRAARADRPAAGTGAAFGDARPK